MESHGASADMGGNTVRGKRVTYSPSWGTSYHASGRAGDQEA